MNLFYEKLQFWLLDRQPAIILLKVMIIELNRETTHGIIGMVIENEAKYQGIGRN